MSSHLRLGRTATRVVAGGVAALLALSPAPAAAQNPISSKVVGSDVARRNRRLLSEYRATRESGRKSRPASASAWAFAEKYALAATADTARAYTELRRMGLAPSDAERQLATSEVMDYLRATSPADTARTIASALCVGTALGAEPQPLEPRTAVALLERLCGVPELKAHVPDALRLALREARDATPGGLDIFMKGPVQTTTPFVEALAWDALGHVLDMIESGHTNPQRWFLGGQLGLRLVGSSDDDGGLVARASVRAAYFIPMSPFRRWQLPVVTNIKDLAAAADDKREGMLKKLATSSEGAFLSLEPTLDAIAPGAYKDFRFQPFVALGGQVNTLKDAQKTDVEFAQGRLGVGSNVELGASGPGRPGLFLTSRATYRVYNRAAADRLFGSRDALKPVIETIALIPFAAGMSVLAEVSATQGSAPFVRFALFSQATPQKANGGQ